MAISKDFIFRKDLQLTSALGHALGHPARVVVMSKLVQGAPSCYSALINGIPLSRPTIHQHVHILKKLGFLQPVLLASNQAGYQLNREFYIRCVQASRREFRQVALIIPLE
ncbi:MAG: DNA-binding transcriptional ArsR family regulator, partial [Neolewinella sp.]